MATCLPYCRLSSTHFTGSVLGRCVDRVRPDQLHTLMVQNGFISAPRYQERPQDLSTLAFLALWPPLPVYYQLATNSRYPSHFQRQEVSLPTSLESHGSRLQAAGPGGHRTGVGGTDRSITEAGSGIERWSPLIIPTHIHSHHCRRKPFRHRSSDNGPHHLPRTSRAPCHWMHQEHTDDDRRCQSRQRPSR